MRLSRWGLTPGAPVTTKQLEAALVRVAVEAEGSFPNVAATGTLDLIERRPPRLKTRESLPQEKEFSHAELPTVEAVLAAVVTLTVPMWRFKVRPGLVRLSWDRR